MAPDSPFDNSTNSYLINADGSGLRLIARGAYHPEWSRDGTLVMVGGTGRGDLRVVPPSGRSFSVPVPARDTASWSSEANRISYFTGAGHSLHIEDLAHHTSRAVALPPRVCWKGRLNPMCEDVAWQPVTVR
jgi:hypothetical protein